jgi:hypothetical protein
MAAVASRELASAVAIIVAAAAAIIVAAAVAINKQKRTGL